MCVIQHKIGEILQPIVSFREKRLTNGLRNPLLITSIDLQGLTNPFIHTESHDEAAAMKGLIFQNTGQPARVY